MYLDGRVGFGLQLRNVAAFFFALSSSLLISATLFAFHHPSAIVFERINQSISSCYYGRSLYNCGTAMTLKSGSLPSILRLVQVRAEVATLLRFAILIPASIRIFIAYSRGNVLISHGAWSSFIRSVVRTVLPITTMLETIASMLLCLLHYSIDIKMFYSLPYVYRMFGATMLLNILLYCLYDICDGTQKSLRNTSLYAKLLCAIAIAPLLRDVWNNFVPFYERGIEHSYDEPICQWDSNPQHPTCRATARFRRRLLNRNVQ
ncbi:hypothetical protein Tcan_06644 [Toxocara canis]|uniref:Uncharacterized protein n=1 Tax=Toxocara canis TaxID=6265 RepID=A0A0B2UZ38_TOXCA|nr:hypothetical protein Tcan_06644 [Toxocara canis]